MQKRIAVLLFLIAFGCVLMSAQQQPAAKTDVEAAADKGAVYRVDYTVFELQDGKRINVRNYSVLVHAVKGARPGQLRLGSKVPLAQKDGTVYMDVGVRIDVRAREGQDGVELDTSMEITSLAEAGSGTVAAAPFIRRMEYAGASLLQPGKPAQLSYMEDVATGRRVHVEATATKVR